MNEVSRSTLPVLNAAGSQPIGRGVSPNAAKRTGWTTPRSNADSSFEAAMGLPIEEEDGADCDGVDEHAETIKSVQEQRPVTNPKSAGVIPMESAIEILESIARENESQRQGTHRRTWLLEQAESQRTSETKEHESQQLAYLEHMFNTVQLLQTDLEKERRRNSSSVHNTSNNAGDPTALHVALPEVAATPKMPAFTKSTKRVDLPARLLQSPLRARLGNGTGNGTAFSGQESAQSDLQSALGRSAELRIHAESMHKNATDKERKERERCQKDEFVAADTLVSSREQKLRDMLSEKLFWQHEYETMRNQVVEEKIRQVELFRRLEKAKREHVLRIEELERALRECHVEIELLRSQLAETKVCVLQQRKSMEEFAKHAKDEKEKLVCSIAETRHKFKEWKEGEAGTLKAARDQVVHNLKTEHELKLARHHEEKQKLRDKVKDLEVSLRLLQKDRNLSPAELSLRKATILGTRESSATTEAELIEAHSRIKELEALLNHAKECQKRQDHLIKVSESTISRLVQEREVVALENLSLQPMAGLTALPLTKVVDPIDSTHFAGFSMAVNTEALSVPLTASAPLTAATSLANDLGIESSVSTSGPNLTRPSTFASHPLHAARENTAEMLHSKRRPSGLAGVVRLNAHEATSPKRTPSGLSQKFGSNDPEKEILRRQSIVLSVEVEKYRQIAVHSLDEIRTLKDSRRRSQHGMCLGGDSQTGNAVNVKEQYLVGEVIKLQAELDAMKKAQMKQEEKETTDTLARGGGERKEASDSNDDDSSSRSDSEDGSSSSESEEESGGQCFKAKLLEAGAKAKKREPFPEETKEAEDARVAEEACGLTVEQKEENVPLSSSAEESIPGSSTPATLEDVTSAVIDQETTAEPVDDKDVAVKMIQSKSKMFMLRKAFVKKKVAIDKIKAQYRGYLVRKNVDLLDRHHQKQFIVTQAMQYKMQIIQPHHETTCKCHGMTLHLVLRVSKDPPIVQIQMQSVVANEETQATNATNDPLSRFHPPMFEEFEGIRVIYFHLFEIIALLPHEEESVILEKPSETEIAETFASFLSVVRIGGQFKFSIHWKKASAFEQREHRAQLHHLPGSNGGSVLNELHVEKLPEEEDDGSRSNKGEGRAREKQSLDDAKELEDLIRKTRIPLADNTVQLDFDEIQTNIGSRTDNVHLKKMLQQLSSSSALDITPERPRSNGSKLL